MPMLACALIAAFRSRRRRWQAQMLEDAGIGASRWQVDRTGTLGKASVSPLWETMTGQMASRSTPVLAWLDAAGHPLDRERALAATQPLLQRNGPQQCRESLRLRPCVDQDWRWYELHAQVTQRSRKGLVRELACTLTDVTWQQTAAERQRISVGLFRHLQEGVLVTDPQFRIFEANPAYCQMLGQARTLLLGQRVPMLQLSALTRAGHDVEQFQQTLAAGECWQGRVSTPHADGSLRTLQITVAPIAEPQGPLRYRVITVTDVSLALRQEQQLERLLHFDSLTGLPNHGQFMRQLREAMSVCLREGLQIVVCRVDLDHFKRVNIQHGTEVADALLMQAAQRLEGAMRNGAKWSDAVARLDGDEFVLLLRTRCAEEARQALNRLMNVLRAPYRLALPGQELVLEITASLGATLFPQDHSDAETLLRHAGHTLYHVKHGGRNDFRFFDSAKRLRDEASLIELARMQEALDGDELRLFFQPKIDMQSGRVLGMEALLRWQHPERGLLAPAQFLPAIDQTGLAVQIGDWVIEHALEQIAHWLDLGLNLSVSVNVTARQLQMPDFAQRLQELVNRHHRPVARYLSLEVLESAALADIEATHDLILRCRAFGVRFALDDFGTGYSTLTYLKKLPVDTLKIDRSFVQDMLTDAQDMALVEGVMGLARHFGAEVIAEGVESAAHARALLRLGCQLGQGNGIAAAMPAAEVPAWVQGFARSPWLMQLGQLDSSTAPASRGHRLA